MADPILVSTAEQLITAYNNADATKTIKVIGDIDFNRGQYSDWENNFFVAPSTSSPSTIILDGSWEDSQGNTKNRTISNIFIYPDKSLFYSDSSNSNINSLNCKNLTFEVISNSGMIVNSYQKCTFENCIFNVRLYSLKYSQFYNYYTGDNRVDGLLSFKNCVFNFYITTCISNDIALFNAQPNGPGQTVYSVIIKSCIFKIRNATNKFITLVDSRYGSYYYLPSKIYNSAIFYNDVGTVQPPYSKTKETGTMRKCHSITGRNNADIPNKIMNTYISSFDYYPLPAGFVKPIILAFNYYSTTPHNLLIPDVISTSFYDGSKIDAYMNDVSSNSIQPVDNYTGCLTKLTTAQCKDPAKLSEIGYLFSEEI